MAEPTERFGFGVQEFAAERPFAGERAEQFDLPEDVLPRAMLAEAFRTTQEMIRGEIPEDVRTQIEQITAEQALSRGIGMGQAARNLTLRDLGLTSLDIQQRGLQTLATFSAIEQQYQALREEQRQWDDKFIGMMQEADLNVAKVELAGAEIVGRIQQFTQGLVADLMVANARQEIPGAQEYLDELAEFFTPTQKAVLGIVGL